MAKKSLKRKIQTISWQDKSWIDWGKADQWEEVIEEPLAPTTKEEVDNQTEPPSPILIPVRDDESTRPKLPKRKLPPPAGFVPGLASYVGC